VRVLVLTENRRLPKHFRLKKHKGVVSAVEFARHGDLAGLLARAEGPVLCYVDLSGADDRTLNRCLKALAARDDCAYGLIDPGRKVKDVARVFHEGAVDYIDRQGLQEGVDLVRLRRVRGYLQGAQPELLEQAAARVREQRTAGYLLSGADWSAVATGREYTFCMMFIELDGKEQMEKNYGPQNLSLALASFRKYVEGFVKSFGGRLWIWYSFGGLVLFPFSGDNCPALTCALRLMLFKHFYDIEISHFPNFLSFRAALHIGNTRYVETNTGNVVSDGLNAIFHLGQQFAAPGECYATEEVLRFGHPALQPYFLESGVFEGRKILRMRRLLHQVGRRP
jgi:hypothetical protein